ncbi:hypothetical protein ACEPPN_001461 [Leptodophora sp. 'Broadleaf-Isolate-01']
MFSTRLIAAAAASLSLMSSVTADYNPASQANLAMYYGQGPSQQSLAHFCNSSSVDIIPIGFINIFPNLANGLVAENFGNQCWDGNYTGPGYNGVNNPKNNFLYRQCPQLQEDIYYCQTKTKKKILLSLGGDGGNYQLNGPADGEYLADFLWGAYGPYNASWVAKGGVRPLDRGASNTDLSKTIDIDGFDFDIEQTSPDNQAGYIACIRRLREHFAAYKLVNSCSKTYLISGAPQCPLPDGNMGLTIAGAQFDLLFIQFYNNGANGCTARNYTTDGNKGGFNYNKWVTVVNQGASKGAKLYLGLLGSSAAGTAGDYLTALESKSLIDAWHGAPQFGGVMLWEATYAENNFPSSFPGKNYYQIIKQLLSTYAPTTTAPATVCSSTVSSSKTSTSTSKTSSSTKISTTSSKSSSTFKTSSTSKPVSSTTSSTSSKITSTSSSKVSSSTVRPTSSSTKISSSSSVKPSSSTIKPSSSSVKPSSSSTKISSSSSTSKAATSSSSSIMTSKTAAGEFTTTSSSTTSSAVPTATGCVYKGCFTEADGIRALSNDVLADFEGMTIEKCADFCSGYTLYGLEYTGECYCGNALNAGSVSAPEAECNLPCTGDASQTCGGSNRLNVYECGALPSSSSMTSSATSSSVSVSESSTSSSATSTVESSSSSESYNTPTISQTFSYSATVTSSSSSEYITPSYSETFSYSATVSSSSSSEYVTPSISETFSYSATVTSSSSSVYITPSYSNTFSYGSTESSSSTSSEYVTPTPSSSSTSETSSSSEYVAPTPSSSSETETTTSSSSSETSSSTKSGPVTSSTYVSSSSSFPTGHHYTNSSTSVGTTKSTYPTGGVTSTTCTDTTSTPTYAPSSSKSSGGEVTYSSKPTSASTTKYTTSTVCTTRVETITSCAPSVTNCPVGSVTTKTIPLYTTVCPVTETEVKSTKTPIGKPTTTLLPTTYKPTGPVKYTTSTVYTTSIYTITSCAPSVTDCPSKLGHVTTEIIKLYTTVCPVTEKSIPVATAIPSTYAPVETPIETPAYTGVAIPSSSSPAGVPHFYGYDSSTTTLSSTTTQYKTIKIVKSTATIMPLPPTTLAPYLTGPASEGYPLGTAAPSAVAQVTSSAEGVTTTKTPVPVYATGAASSSRSAVGVMVAGVAGVVAFMML